jgi:hypothetical protein
VDGTYGTHGTYGSDKSSGLTSQASENELAPLTSAGISSCSSGLVWGKDANSRHASQREVAGAFAPKGL